jgi:hypothetical protein
MKAMISVLEREIGEPALSASRSSGLSSTGYAWYTGTTALRAAPVARPNPDVRETADPTIGAVAQ